MADTVITKQIIVCGVAGIVPGCAVEQVKVAIVVQVREAGAVGPSIEVCDSAPFSVFDKQPSVDVVKEQIGHRLAENHGDIQIGKSVGIDVGKQDSMTTSVRTGRATGASQVGNVGEMRFAAHNVLLGKACHTHRQAKQLGQVSHTDCFPLGLWWIPRQFWRQERTRRLEVAVMSPLFYDTGAKSVKQHQVLSAARPTVLLSCGTNKRSGRCAILSRHCYRMKSHQTICV